MCKLTNKPKRQTISMNINEAHCKFCHGHEDAVPKAANHLGIRITHGKMKPCTAYTEAKAKQKNVPKVSFHLAGGSDAHCIFLDLASIKQPKDGLTLTKRHWCMVVDEKSTWFCSLLVSMRPRK